jgi:hypothetical protein
MNTALIQSLKDLQLRMPAIINEYGSNNYFTQLALANPLIALERAGFQFTPGAKDEIEHYVRFGRSGLDRLHFLKEAIYKQTGEAFDLDNTEQLTGILLRIADTGKAQPSNSRQKLTYSSSTPFTRDKLADILMQPPLQHDNEWQDGLQVYAGIHPVMPLLMEYRKMQAEHPRFASPEKIGIIEEKLKTGPLKNVVFTLQRNTPR